MNRAYKLVWNRISNSWVVTSELARGRKKSSSIALKLAVLMAAGLATGVATAAPAANALPTGESVAGGTATFDRSVANQLTVNQSTSKLITNWNSFDVGSNGKVVFAQPDAASIALNRVTGGSATEILGQVTANGQLVLVNPNGITFGTGSQVNAASIIGSVLDIQDSDFNVGTLLFSRGAATGSIENKGSLTATSGSVSLLAPTVKNSGSISATGGSVALINADAADLTAADPSISTASSIAGLIQQSGTISATQVSSVGGKILLTGDTSQSGSQIQLAGTLDATTNTNVNGRSILVNGDVHLNGASNVLDLTSTDGYSLTNAAKINLNGASSGFSVNGTAYTVIRDVSQLQAISSNLAGGYVLAADIDANDTLNWNSGAGFVPVGTAGSAFTGVLDGLGHEVDGLYINRSAQAYVGLLGYTLNAAVKNIGLTDVNITGLQYVGALVGYASAINAGTSTFDRVYVRGGSVSGSSGYVGGVAGALLSESSGGNTSMNNSYSTVNVSGYNRVGGLVGMLYVIGSLANSNVTVKSSYATGNVTGTDAGGGGGANFVGGLVGRTFTGSGLSYTYINDSYASGAINTAVPGAGGGFIGYLHQGAILNNNYWNTDTSGRANGVGENGSGVVNQLAGLTTAQSTQLASFANWGSSIDAQGSTGSTWRIYEGQTAPLLRTFLKPVTLTAGSASKTYDGTNYVINGSYTLSDAGASLLGTATYAGTASGARNAGTYSITASGLYSGQQGYDIGYADGTLTINKRLLTISAVADSKVYDGKLTSAGKPVVVGRQRGDAIVGLTQSFADKNAGTGKTINVDAAYTIRDGNNGNNYDVVIVNSNAGVITPKALTISTVANSKVYDGGVTSVNKPLVTGLLSGDRVTGLFQQYQTKTVGENKQLLVKSGYVVQDGNAGGNYVVTEQTSNDGVITAH